VSLCQRLTKATHTCNRALAKLLISGEWDQNFPSPYIITQARLERKLPFDDYVQLVCGPRQASLPSLTA
jgi:hypothetical protein